jgi:hypothetical protein
MKTTDVSEKDVQEEIGAQGVSFRGQYCVRQSTGVYYGFGETPAEAMADAARMLKSLGHPKTVEDIEAECDRDDHADSLQMAFVV